MATLAEQYVSFWRHILVGWLHWSKDDFATFVSKWSSEMNRLDSLFYHYDELHYIVDFLVADEIKNKLQLRHDKIGYLSDYEYYVGTLLYPAIYGKPPYKSPVATADYELAFQRYQEAANRIREECE